MEKLVLYIGNRNDSSWSMRAWMALEGSGIPFEDLLIPFDFAAGNPEIKAVSPTGLVPFLRHGTVTVWETLSIIEYAAELFRMPVCGRRIVKPVRWRAPFQRKCMRAFGRCVGPAP